MFDNKPRRDDEKMDIFNRMFQPVNELLDQGASAIDSRLATFKADVKRVNNKYLIEAELPGYQKDEISIDYDNSYLMIRAEKETNDEVKEKGKIIRRERHTGQAIRRFYVSGVEKDEIKAVLTDGILHIEMPIKESEDAYSKRIEIL